MKIQFLMGVLALLLAASCQEDEVSIEDSSNEMTYEQFYGTGGDDSANSLLQLSDGGYLLVGTEQPGVNDSRMLVVRTDERGNEQWSRSFGEPGGLGGAAAVVEAPGGGFYVCGQWDEKPAVLHLDAQGNLDWQAVLNRTGLATGLAVDAGRLLVVGHNFSESFTFQVNPEQGDVLGIQEVPHESNLLLNDLASLPSGGYMAVGQAFQAGIPQLALCRFSREGVFQELNLFAEWQGAVGTDLIVNRNGELVACGVTARSNNETGLLLVAFTQEGERLWGDGLDVGANEFAFGLCEAAEGGYLLVGRQEVSGQGEQVLLAKFGSMGEPEWQHTRFGGSLDEEAKAVVSTADGGFAIAGETASYGLGGRDIYLLKTNSKGRLQ